MILLSNHVMSRVTVPLAIGTFLSESSHDIVE